MAKGIMSGSGTKEDPYLCEDVYDFCNFEEYNGTSTSDLKYVKLVNNLDFNDHELYKYGFNKQGFCYGKYIYLYGDNHEIRNLAFITPLKRVDTPYEFSIIELYGCEKVLFTNVFLLCKETFNVGLFAGNYFSCSFSIRCFYSDFKRFTRQCGSETTFQNCVFFFLGTCNSSIQFSFMEFVHCKVVFLNLNASFSYESLYNYPIIINKGNFLTTSFEGVINLHHTREEFSTRAYLFGWENEIMVNNCSFLTNICFDATQITELVMMADVSCLGVSFANKNLIENNERLAFIEAIGGKWLTTAQCKTKDYLRSIEFMVL